MLEDSEINLLIDADLIDTSIYSCVKQCFGNHKQHTTQTTELGSMKIGEGETLMALACPKIRFLEIFPPPLT